VPLATSYSLAEAMSLRVLVELEDIPRPVTARPAAFRFRQIDPRQRRDAMFFVAEPAVGPERLPGRGGSE